MMCSILQASSDAVSASTPSFIKNSVIGRGVIIEKGAKVENSIILTNAYIGKDSVLKNCIIDKNARIIHNNKLTGDKNRPLIVKERDII